MREQTETKGKVFIIEDDPSLRMIVSDRLLAEGYQVETAMDGAEGYNRAQSNSYDVILLDVMLPKKNGLDVLRDLRAHDVVTPILMLTAMSEVSDKVVGLKLGADDYLTKPFEMIELMARVEALLRRPTNMMRGTSPLATFRFNSIDVNFETMEVSKAGTPIELTAKEFQLLSYLIEHRGKLVSRDAILNAVWGYETAPNSRTVDTHIAWLRQKLESNPKNPRHITTHRGLGYKFLTD